MQHIDMSKLIQHKKDEFFRYAQYNSATEIDKLFKTENRPAVTNALLDSINHALHLAVAQVNLDTIEYLVEVLGADVNSIQNGNPLLHHAVMGQIATPNHIIVNNRRGTREARNELVEFLINRGAKTNVSNKGKKVFFEFVKDCHKNICDRVINEGMLPAKIPAWLEEHDPREFQYQLRYIKAKETISTFLKDSEFDENQFTQIMLRFGTYPAQQWINEILSLRDIIKAEEKYLKLELVAKGHSSIEEKRECKADSTSDALAQLSKMTTPTQATLGISVMDQSAATSPIAQPSQVVDTPTPKLTGVTTLFQKAAEEGPTKNDTSTSQPEVSGKKYPKYNPSSVSSLVTGDRKKLGMS